MKNKNQNFDLIASISDYFKLTPFQGIISWVEKYINYTDDVSAERDKPDFSQYPYQVEILEQWEDLNTRKHVTVMACEQLRLRQTCSCLGCCGAWCMTHAKA